LKKSINELKAKLLSISKGQFIENIFKFEVIQLKNNILGRKIVVTKKNISNFFEELRTVRLACRTVKKGKNIIYQLEQIPKGLQRVATALGITNVTN